jgi:hypothetical protein
MVEIAVMHRFLETDRNRVEVPAARPPYVRCVRRERTSRGRASREALLEDEALIAVNPFRVVTGLFCGRLLQLIHLS